MKTLLQKWRELTAWAVLAATTLSVAAAPQVETLGGGPNQTSAARTGSTDGDTFAFAKFKKPSAVSLDTNGSLFIADYGNGKIRKVTNPGGEDSLTSTFASKLKSPSGVVIGPSNTVYVVTQRDGRLSKFSSAGALLQTVSGFRAPTAVAISTDGTVYVTELSGGVYQVSPDGARTFILGGFRRPRGIAVLANGLLAITESTGHAVQLLDPATGISTLIAGGHGAGLAEGAGTVAKFNQPYTIAVAPNGSLVVADRLNHRVRVIDTNYVVSTLFGVPKKQWFKPFPGWVDGAGGDNGVAATRDPVGVAVGTNGTVFSTELYWNLIRQTTLTGLGVSNGLIIITNIDSTNIFTALPAPTFGPQSGYFPFGVSISVTSSAPVYYTTDGTDPTTNSRQVVLVGNVGTIRFTENLRDLTSLRLKAFSTNAISIVVGGTNAARSELSIPRNFVAGSGSTILVPVVANLRAGARIQSFQYRVEITPLNGAPPILPYLTAMSMSENDYVPVVTAAAAGQVAHYTTSGYSVGNTLGLVVSASGTNAFVDFQNFATTALLAVPIDPAASAGHTYRIRILEPSATSDGYGTDLPVVAGADRTITISSVPYLVGDSAPGAGYNAGEFGDNDLRNNDANAVLFASLGIHTPFKFSDAYNAMDSFPPEPSAFGGDGFLEFADWQVVLDRSLRLDTENWTRRWVSGNLQSDPVSIDATLASPAKPKAASVAKSSGSAWSRGATLKAGNLYNTPAGACEVPVSIKVAPGMSVAGMAFRVIVESVNGAPPISDVSFAPLLGNSGFLSAAGTAPNDIVCAWTMVPSSPFTPVLQGNQLIGNVRFTMPPLIDLNHHYTIRFVRPSGAANLQTSVSFEGIPGSVWIGNQSPPPARTSDEWRVNFFGSIDDPAGEDDADPDGDGVLNWQEYLNGTNPNL